MAQRGTHTLSAPVHVESGAAADAAFTELVRAHSRYVWRVLRGMGVREGDVDDLCQEVFVIIHRKLPELALRSALRSWIYGIALRVARDYRQRAHRRYEDLVAEPNATRAPAQQDRALERQQHWALLDRVMAELTDDQRQVFVLFEIEELSMREVCEIAGCPLQTAYSRLHTARARIADKLARLRAQGTL